MSVLALDISTKMSLPPTTPTKYKKKRNRNRGQKAKKYKPSCAHVTPKKFLLGGTISDPLNLKGLSNTDDQKVNNTSSPKSSPSNVQGSNTAINYQPLPIPIHQSDPLKLMSCPDDEEYRKHPPLPLHDNPPTSKKKNKKRKRVMSTFEENESNCNEQVNNEKTFKEPSEETQELPAQVICTQSKASAPEDEFNRAKKQIKRLKTPMPEDYIVSPVVPQPGAFLSRTVKYPKFNKKNEKFEYGNYNKYYGYRNNLQPHDIRLTVFRQRPDLFYDKDILDIGCNIGTITVGVARTFYIRSIMGIDIDKKLIDIAKKTIKNYIQVNQPEFESSLFPISMSLTYGPIHPPRISHNSGLFPHNIKFSQGNYALEDDSGLEYQKPEYDTILCLSVTKWIHLNNGDEGLKRCFRRMYKQLRPGGVLILEPQSWSSYGRKKNLTERIYQNYRKITFLPEKFTPYLLSIGFEKCEELSTPPHPFKGFQRPIYLYTKKNEPEMAEDAVAGPSAKRISEEAGSPQKIFPGSVQSDTTSFYDNLPYMYAPGMGNDSPIYSNSRMMAFRGRYDGYSPDYSPYIQDRSYGIMSPAPRRFVYASNDSPRNNCHQFQPHTSTIETDGSSPYQPPPFELPKKEERAPGTSSNSPKIPEMEAGATKCKPPSPEMEGDAAKFSPPNPQIESREMILSRKSTSENQTNKDESFNALNEVEDQR
ncbi:probable RNA methyltransferase bin3 isoform X1 [Trichogramma pretiosum]|uniref:probable RNA methyltransferase bin3 isoform X1 n=1 Tax=Trichogramma pretiosum TaxID=7493 RepID=UPI0006C96A43|nr:probable RNA methyltransferase bin3 isoform X1 [Trichogramma pretiosum]